MLSCQWIFDNEYEFGMVKVLRGRSKETGIKMENK